MRRYTVKQLAHIAGVSVRTLHLYDKIDLLKPSVRTEARYRLYDPEELLRLQQILFYKELGFSLQEIKEILDDPDFNIVNALESHKDQLRSRKERLELLMQTIDKTILKLKGTIMMNDEELYEGLPKEKAEAYRKEASQKYGEETVKRSEDFLKKLGKQGLEELKAESADIRQKLYALKEEDATSEAVQKQISRHYHNIRMFWGTSESEDKQKEAYKGLGQLYVNDERFTIVNGQSDPRFGKFLCEAMAHFADENL
jgi:DNA-binding transcriptional MerR regulator